MKILRIIGFSIVGLLFLLVVISFFLPSKFYFERSVVVNAKPKVPYGLVSNFKEWDKWSPWNQLDSNMKKDYSATTAELGSWFSWSSEIPEAGSGKMTINELIADKRIQIDFEFEDMGHSEIVFAFDEVERGTKITWSIGGSGEGMPWYFVIPSKYFHLFMESLMEKDFNQGLSKIKEVSEAAPPLDQVAGFDVEERTIEPMILAGVRSVIGHADLNGNTFGKWYAQISQTLSAQQIKPAGPPVTIYHNYGPKEVDVEAAIPVVSQGSSEGKVVYRQTTAYKALVLKYYGGFNDLEPVYMAAYDYIKAKGQSSSGAPMEIYLTDPGTEKDTSKWLTEIVFPLD